MVIYLFLLLLLPSIIILLITAAKPRPLPPLPPGPKPWPIIGNLLQLSKKIHVSFAAFSKLHGPLISLRLGSQLVVVASSPAAAVEILRTHDRFLSARYFPRIAPFSIAELDRKAIIWSSSCNDNWKNFRSIFKNQLFSAKAIEAQAAVRERKAAEMVNFVGSRAGEEIDVGEVVFTTAFDSLSNLIFSRDIIGFEKTATAAKLKSLVWRMMELGAAPNLSDFFPVLEKLDLQGLRRENIRNVNELFSVWKTYVKERREIRIRRRGDDTDGDFLDIFLENGLDDDQIDWLNLELFMAGSDTNTTTIEWAMTELIRNRVVMEKLLEELKTEFPNRDQLLKEADVYQLPYLTATIKETLRLHPPAPLLLPHRSPETLQVMNYTIPEGAKVMVNVWAIGRDCSIWGDDASSFKPERFVGSSVDVRGQNFELLSFGAGRRMCPGIPLAARQIPLLLANLVWSFDWCLPKGVESAAELDMEEKFGVTLQREMPLVLVPHRRISSSSE